MHHLRHDDRLAWLLRTACGAADTSRASLSASSLAALAAFFSALFCWARALRSAFFRLFNEPSVGAGFASAIIPKVDYGVMWQAAKVPISMVASRGGAGGLAALPKKQNVIHSKPPDTLDHQLSAVRSLTILHWTSASTPRGYCTAAEYTFVAAWEPC